MVTIVLHTLYMSLLGEKEMIMISNWPKQTVNG